MDKTPLKSNNEQSITKPLEGISVNPDSTKKQQPATTVLTEESNCLDEELEQILELYDTSVEFIESAAHREQIGPAKFSKFYSTNWSNDLIPRADSIKASYDFLRDNWIGVYTRSITHSFLDSDPLIVEKLNGWVQVSADEQLSSFPHPPTPQIIVVS